MNLEPIRALLKLARNGGPWKCGEPLLVHDVNILQDLKAALPALSQLLEAVAWQPIETAPKDGTEILIATKLDVYTAYWRDEAEFYQGETKPGWQLFSCEEDIFYSSAVAPEDATHWMPIHAAPKGPK